MALAFRTKNRTFVKCHFGLAVHQLLQTLSVQSECAAIDPQQVSSLWSHWLHLWQMLCKVADGILCIAADMLHEFVQPFAAFIVGRFHRLRRKECRHVQAERFKLVLKFPSQLRIGGYDVRGLQTRQIERLGCRQCGQCNIRQLFRQGREWNMLVARHRQIAMNFIRNDRHAVPQAQIPKTKQLLTLPHSAARIMRTAQQQQLGSAGHQLFELIIIHDIMAFFKLQRIDRHLAVIHPDHIIKRIIHRRLQNHLIARVAEQLYRKAQRGNDAGGINNPFLLKLPVMASAVPAGNRLFVGITRHAIAVNPLLHAAQNRFLHGRRALKVHIGYPERKNVLVSEQLLGLVPFV
ncbi:hypothetical protein D3C75_707050 [compost metagenome]